MLKLLLKYMPTVSNCIMIANVCTLLELCVSLNNNCITASASALRNQDTHLCGGREGRGVPLRLQELAHLEHCALACRGLVGEVRAPVPSPVTRFQ